MFVGWHITSIGCSNTSIIISADDSLIAWGASPTFGELVSKPLPEQRICSILYICLKQFYLKLQGLGELQKSTTTPKEVSKLEGMKMPQVAMGYSHSMILVNTDHEATKEKYDKQPEYDLDD